MLFLASPEREVCDEWIATLQTTLAILYQKSPIFSQEFLRISLMDGTFTTMPMDELTRARRECASAVISIFYLAHSEYKLFYTAITAFVIYMVPRILDDPLAIPAIPQLQPTLAVWALMILLVELIPRTKPDSHPTPDPETEETDQ